MAPRKAEQTAAKNIVVAAADGNVLPPKKKKVTAKSASTEDEPPRQAKAKGKAKQQLAKANKQNEIVVDEPAKMSHGKQKNTAGTTFRTIVAATKNTKSTPKKQIAKKPINNDEDKKVAEKKTRGGSKVVTTAEKAGTKITSLVTAKKQKTRAMDDAAEDAEKKSAVDKNPAMKVTRRMKIIDIAIPPAQPATMITRKRENVEDTGKAVGSSSTRMQVTKVKQEKEKRKNEAEVAGKEPRGKTKEMETVDALPISKGRSKKNLAKEIAKPSPEEAEIKKQNTSMQEDNLKAKNVNNAKEGNIKETISNSLNAAVEIASSLNAAVEIADEIEINKFEILKKLKFIYKIGILLEILKRKITKLKCSLENGVSEDIKKDIKFLASLNLKQ